MKKKGGSSGARTAAIYARFSSHNQREESIEQQVAECLAFAEREGIRVAEVYSDEAMTGRNDKRPRFQKMQRDAEKGAFDTIIAYKSNRLARNMLNALMFEEKMNRIGISVVYAKEEFGNNAAGRFALRTMMNVNQFYSENLSEDIKRAMTDNAKKCLSNGPLPYGYVSDHGSIQICEDKAGIVREIYQRVLNEERLADIARDLNERGIRINGREWGKSSFRNILSNERYTGVYLYGSVRVEGGMPVIVDRETFDAVQNYKRKKGNPVGRKKSDYGYYALTGKVFCGICGEPMIGISGTGRSGSLYYYYTCRGHRSKEACQKKPVGRDYLEHAVAKALVDQVLTPEVIRQAVDSVFEFARKFEEENGLDVIKKELKDTRNSIRNILKAIEAGIFTATTKIRLEELETTQTQLESKLKTAEGMKDGFPDREELEQYMNRFHNADIEDPCVRNELFTLFLVSVYCYDDHFTATFDVSGNKPRSVNIYTGGNTPSGTTGATTKNDNMPEDKMVRIKKFGGHQKTPYEPPCRNLGIVGSLVTVYVPLQRKTPRE